MINENFIYLGVLINLIGSSYYIIKTLRGEIRPNRVTFLLFSIIPLITYFAQSSQGVGIQSLFTLSTALIPLLILLATFSNKDAYWKIRKLDISMGTLSFLGIVLWYITGTGNSAISLSIIADGLAFIPTYSKSLSNPETEFSWAWLSASISGTITLLTIPIWSFEEFGFPLYVVIATLIEFIIVQFRIGKKLKTV